jgi:hypothetical protein
VRIPRSAMWAQMPERYWSEVQGEFLSNPGEKGRSLSSPKTLQNVGLYFQS